MVIKNLIEVFYRNPKWSQNDLTITELATTSVGIAVLRIADENFIWDVSNLIRGKLSEIDGENMEVLINLAKTSRYFKDFKGNSDYHILIHNEAARLLEGG